VKPDHPAIVRGVEYLRKSQEADGSWYGRWGVNYIYGTFLALRGLEAAGEDNRDAHILRAGEWIRSIQNADGGWGESCASYDNKIFTAAPSSPSQTAWGVLGLLAGGDTNSSSLFKGVEWLIEHQRADGGWDEELSTGTGFPKVFYLKYHYYRHSFPVLALSMYRKARAPRVVRDEIVTHSTPRVVRDERKGCGAAPPNLSGTVSRRTPFCASSSEAQRDRCGPPT
jgi:squalene-hopene/tetraprenyl-beta-curcumene cyclase